MTCKLQVPLKLKLQSSTGLRSSRALDLMASPSDQDLCFFSGLMPFNALDRMARPSQDISSKANLSAMSEKLRFSGLTASSALDRFPSFTGLRASDALDRLNVFHSQDDLFSEQSEAIILSREEAPRLGHNFVGTEQILLGLIGEGTGIAAKVLKSMGINLKDARVEVEKIIGRVSGSTDIPFTPRANRVLEFSLEEARQLGEGVAARVLKSLGLDLVDVRTQVILMIGGNHEVTSKDSGGTIKTPTLEYGTNLTKLAEEGKLYPVVGREPLIEGVVEILSRVTTNNPCLIGEPGVGKTAIAEGLAQLIVSVYEPITLKGKTVISINMGRLKFLEHLQEGRVATILS
ncbi:unnamed protein product [Microthlaspi erraticum]|uniref:Clp R domain-containing protein n=1 Tax=Microthlaspi erraticum TaxID=1685480 RepID=A0A6D2J805_9BRAS|nr:unnamed protein product [Microthlaspi erraticum]